MSVRTGTCAAMRDAHQHQCDAIAVIAALALLMLLLTIISHANCDRVSHLPVCPLKCMAVVLAGEQTCPMVSPAVRFPWVRGLMQMYMHMLQLQCPRPDTGDRPYLTYCKASPGWHAGWPWGAVSPLASWGVAGWHIFVHVYAHM